MEAKVIGSKVTVVKFLTGGHQVENDAGPFVGSRCWLCLADAPPL